MAKAKANALKTEFVKKRKLEDEANAVIWMLSKMWCQMNAWRDFISHEIDVPKESDADCNFLKIHLMSHWVKQIH